MPPTVPERDIDAADGVGERTPAPHPEAVLMQLLRDPLRLQRVLALIVRRQHLELTRHHETNLRRRYCFTPLMATDRTP